jgi:exopolyphosphatase/guanosine-5'-triphosphate,3'-diphosphate pyrophosphatase
MSIASIDIGTNTVLLLILSGEQSVIPLLEKAVIARLGENLQRTGLLREEAMERTFDTLKGYLAIAAAKGVSRIICVGTAALREAKNGPLFLDRLKGSLGLSVKVLSEEEEAYYTYLSVRDDKMFPGDRLIIIDIGGGSTEIIWGDRRRFERYLSLPIGSVKLTEMFIRSDPPLEGEVTSLLTYLKDIIALEYGAPEVTLVGTAGTVTNLASIVLGLDEFDAGRIHGAHITLNQIASLLERLMPLSVRERRSVQGMEAGRADVFPQGIILLKEIMKALGATEILVSVKGVRYGAIAALAGEQAPPGQFP